MEMRNGSASREFADESIPFSYLLLLLVEDACDMALNWIRPIPAPPTAPARSPSSNSIGILSSRDLFFLNFVIPLSPIGLCLTNNVG